jgi:hypothetical protein
LTKSVSVDGFIEGPERELDWPKVDELARDFSMERVTGIEPALSAWDRTGRGR